MPRLPPPGPSYLRELPVRVRPGPERGERSIRVGMNAPTTTAEGWWLAVLWAADEAGIVDLRDVAPHAGPPADPPLFVLGPAFAGSLSGFVAEEGGRQALRLRLPPAEDDSRPWERPLVLQVALRWEPVRTATLTQNQLAREALQAFARAIEAASSPG